MFAKHDQFRHAHAVEFPNFLLIHTNKMIVWTMMFQNL